MKNIGSFNIKISEETINVLVYENPEFNNGIDLTLLVEGIEIEALKSP